MSTHASKYHIVHNTKNGPTYRVELLKKGFVGSSTRKNAGGEIFALEYESLDPKTVFSNPLQKSSLTLHLVIEGSSEITILQNIFGSDEDEYRLRLKIDGSTYWEGAVLADLMEYSEGELYSTAQIRAKDLSRLKGQTYSLTTGRDDIITVIADILSGLGLGLGIKTATSWTEKNISDSDDFLDEISLDKSRIRQFARTEEEDDQAYNKLEVLEMICKNFGLILRQQDGYWWITQITEQANDPVTVYEYNSSGTFQSSSSVDLDAPVNKVDRWLQPQGQNKNYVGIQQARVAFRHNTKEQVLSLPENITLTSSNSSIDPIDFLSDGDQKVKLSFDVEADADGGVTSVKGRFELRVGSSGNYYYLKNNSGAAPGDTNLEWATSQTDYLIPLQNFDVNPNDPDGPGEGEETTSDTGGTWRKQFGVNITTPDIPADADGTLRITFKPAIDNNTNIVNETRFINIGWEIVNPTIQENNKSVEYSLTQAGETFSETFDFGDTWFGDGPASYSKSALTWFDGAENVPTVSQWRRDGGTAELALQVLLLRELLDIQRNHIEGKRAALLGDYKTQQILTTDSGATRYFFLSGQLSGKRSEWDAYFFRIDINTAGDDSIGTFYDEDEDGAGPSGGGGGNGEDPKAIGELTADVSSTTATSLPVNVYAGKAIESGKDYFIWHLAKQRPISFTALEDLDAGDATLTIEEQVVVAPDESKIYKEEGQKETERIIQVEQQTATESARASLSLSVKNERQATSLGTTVNQVSGTVTSIDLENIPFEVKVEDGDVLTILSTEDSDEGNNEEITVSGNQTITPSTHTLNINSIALSNTYPAGSAVFEPAVGLTSRISLVSEVTTSNSSSIASLETDVSALESTLVLKAEVTSGEITKLAYIQLDASIAGGSAITLAADQIRISGDTTFDSGFDPSDGRTVIRQNTAPSTRPSGDPLQTGDIWLDTDDGNKPYSWNGSSFDPDYTNIDGGNIVTGTIAAARITVGAGSTFNQGFDPSDGRVVIRQTTTPSARPSGDPLKDGDVWIDTDNGDKPYTYNGTGFDASYTEIDGGSITTGTVVAARVAIGTNTQYESGFDPSDGRVVIRQNAEPSTRPSGDPLKEGDVWIDTDNGDKPYTYNGTNFIASYTVIDGGNITTGTVTASQIDVDDLFAETIVIDSAGSIESSNFISGSSGFKIEGGGTAEFADITLYDADLVDPNFTGGQVSGIEIVNGLPASGDFVGQVFYDTSETPEPRGLYRWDGDSFERTIDGADLVVDSVTATKIASVKLSVIEANAGTMTISSTGKITNTAGDYTIDANGISLTIGTGSAQSLEWYDGATRKSFVNSTASGVLQLAGWDGSVLNVGITIGSNIQTLLELETTSGLNVSDGVLDIDVTDLQVGHTTTTDRVYRVGRYLAVSGGTDGALRSPLLIPIYNDASRPAASSHRGGLIYNTDARSGSGGLQFADETGTWIGS